MATDLNAYFARIGYVGSADATVATLRDVVAAPEIRFRRRFDGRARDR